MIVIDNGDAIRGIAEVASKLDFTVNGYVGTTATQLADGQLSNAEADLYASGADATVVTSITVVNTDTSARTFTLYLKPSGGTSRAISPVSLDLGIGHCFYTDGQRIVVMNLNGEIINAWAVDDTPVDGELNHPISSNYMYDHVVAADPHTGYSLESLMDAKGDLRVGTGDNAEGKLTVGVNGKFLEAASGETTGMKWSTVATTFSALTDVEVVLKEDEDQVVSNSTTLVNDDYLLFAIAANEVWRFQIFLNYLSGTTPDIKFAITVPTDGVLRATMWGESAGGYLYWNVLASGTAHKQDGYGITDGTNNRFTIITGYVTNAANAGNIQLQWAQNTAEATDTKVMTNSYIIAHKLA